MAALVPPGGVPCLVLVMAPSHLLPFAADPGTITAADPGTITGWLLDATLKMWSRISREMERGLITLMNKNIRDFGNASHNEAMRDMAD
jgi:hypothetical protein